MHDRSRRERKLVPTTGALPTPLLYQLVCAPLRASRTNKAIRPTTSGQILLAGFFGGANFAWNSLKVFGNGGRGTRPYYPLGFVETTGQARAIFLTSFLARFKGTH